MNELHYQQATGGERDAVFEAPSLVAAAHELKAPLALIRQLTFELQSGAASPEIVMAQIQHTTERALRLTSDITRAARLEDSLFDLSPLNPRVVCEQVVREISPLYEAHGRRIKVTRGRQVLAIGHDELLRRILLGFADNALHYAPSAAPVELSISRREHGRVVRLGVRDYGPRVTTNLWRTLQQTVGRSAQPLAIRPESSGLGLFMAGKFARTMNGHVGVIRHRDGATFFVDIHASTQLSLLI